MRDRSLAIAWVVTALLLAGLFTWAFVHWRSLSTRASQAAAERTRLAAQMRSTEEQILKEMRSRAGLLQEMQWTVSGNEPGVFLTRLADLAQGGRMKVTAIGPLERRPGPQFTKTWHVVHVLGPFHELRDMAARVEQERGVLEDVFIEAAKEPTSDAGTDVQARFRLVALELSGDAKKLLDRTLAASGARPEPPPTPGGAIAVPVPSPRAPASGLRNPFAFAGSPAGEKRAVSGAGAAASPPAASGAAPAVAAGPPPEPETVLELRGIVDFPGGALAILNNQIVRPGDTVSGLRVERITERSVTLRRPDGRQQVIELPDIGMVVPLPPGSPAPPRR
ncbi:MAG: general secretion pathway protein GspB [Candidatus Rokubacteria bacterium]|nr:general secretion pathway protein GspB [Candidatus Rokubacteria bacterium]